MSKSFLIASAALLSAPTASEAAVLFTSPGTVTEISSPNQVQTPDIYSGGGPGLVSFILEGFNTLDGANNGSFTDIFTLSLNGTAIYSASFVLGGQGDNVIYFAPPGATQSVVNTGFNLGGTATISVPLLLVAGANYLAFAYDSPTPQGLGDEGWGLRSIRVEGIEPGAGAVPEPATWAMFIGGFGLVGAALRHRRRVAVSFG